MTTKANPLRLLLDQIRAQRIAPVGVDEYVQVDRLLLRRPELRQQAAREELRYALASLLATDADQWSKIWNLSKEWLDDEVVPVTTPIGRQVDATASIDASISPAERALRAFADLPRWLMGLGAAVLLATLAVLLLALVGGFDPVVVVKPPPADFAPEGATTQWRKVPLDQDARSIDIAVPNKPRDMSAKDSPVFVISGLLLILGVCWVLLPQRIRKMRREQAEANGKRGLEQRREMSREAERGNVSRRLIYHVVRVPPMRDDAAADTATMLGRLFGRNPDSTLDVDRTIDATVAEGGRFVPVLTERRVARSLTLLVDVEGGSHPWLNDINWLLDRWRVLGVQFQRYEYQFEPLFLTDAATNLHTAIEKLARRAAGEPLLIISRKLIAQEFHGEARWLRHARAWPTRAWLDPSPRPPEELPDAYRSEIARLARRGFRRFPFTEQGLVALASFLVSEGHGLAAPEWPELPPLSDRNVAEAVEKWALFASLVPDPTWEQLQAVRESFPEIHAVLPENRHLQCLLEWAEQMNDGNRAESSDGITLELDARRVDELILRFRKAEAGLPETQQLENRCRRLLLAQLSATEPEDPLMHQFWQLKRVRHELVLNPDKALALLGSLIAGPWHDEVLEVVGTELKRDKTVKSLPAGTSDAMRLAVDYDSNLLRLGDLVHLPRAFLAPIVATVVILVSLTFILLEDIPLLGDALLSVSSNFAGIVPRDYRLEPTRSVKTAQQPSGLLRELKKIDPTAQAHVDTAYLVRDILLSGLDGDGSGDLNTKEEILPIDCDTIMLINELVLVSAARGETIPGGYDLYYAFGFATGIYVGDAIGINEVLKSDIAALLKKCGARATK